MLEAHGAETGAPFKKLTPPEQYDTPWKAVRDKWGGI